MHDPAAPSGLTRRQAIGVLSALALPWEQLLAQAASSGTPATATPPGPAPAASTLAPDLPNFHETMQWIAQQSGPKLSFLDTKWRDLETWKKAALPALRQCLSYDPQVPPVSAEVLGREERDGFTIETVSIQATPTYNIPARVLVPTGRTGRLPAVVALHCHGGRFTWGHEKVLSSPGDSPALIDYRNGLYGRPWTEVLARRGYIVIAADGFYFGQRRLKVEDLDPARVFPEVRDAFNASRNQTPGSTEWVASMNRVCGFYEHLTAKTLTAAGATWPGIHVWDDMRTVDYLVSRPDVDLTRLGCVGLSGGGFRSALLAGLDPRIKAASVTGWMTEFGQQLRNHIRHTWMVFTPGLYKFLDLPDVASLHAPGALLVQQCRRDTLYPLPAMQAAVDKIAHVYAKAGMPEKFRGTFYDEPHSFKPAMQDEAFAWLDQWLR